MFIYSEALTYVGLELSDIADIGGYIRQHQSQTSFFLANASAYV